MTALRRYPAALLLLVAAACGGGGPQSDRVLAAAGSAGEAAPAPTAPPAPPILPSTITSPPITAPATTTTTKRPAPTTTAGTASGTRTTRVPVTPSPPIAGYSPAPPPPGVAADGYGGYGGFTEVSAGPVTLELSVYPREQYLGERAQVGAKVTHPANVAITSLKLDFGNGHVVTGGLENSWYCNTAQDASAGTGGYVYPAPGNFRITATVTFVTCMGVPGAYIGPPLPPPTGLVGPWFPEPHQSLSAAIPFLQRPDLPPRPVGPPPGP